MMHHTPNFITKVLLEGNFKKKIKKARKKPNMARVSWLKV